MSNKWEDLPELKNCDFEFNTKTTNSSYVKMEQTRPDTKKINKIKLFGAVVFSIVTIPIIYHAIKDHITLYLQPIEQKNLEVRVTQLKYSDIYDTTEVTGYVSPGSSVDVVARVDGYLENTFFKEGDFVTKGQLLFKIEDAEYKISVKAAEAEVSQAKAIYTNSLQELERAKILIKENFISRSDYDSIVASADSTKASLDSAHQSLARAKLNLNYTNIYAPISGKAGKINMSNGNYVGLSSGPLVNIAKTDPVSINFSMKSSDLLKMKLGNSGNLDINTAKVELILSDNSKYNQVGKIVFSDNAMLADAASLSLKATFANPDNILIPGDYVRVLITSKDAKRRLLAPHLLTRGDSINGYYVWTVVDNKTKKKKITVDKIKDNAWIVVDGITENDTIIEYSTTPINMENMNVVVRNKDTKK